MIGNTLSSWGTFSRAFHWGLGLAHICKNAYGWWGNHLTPPPDRYNDR